MGQIKIVKLIDPDGKVYGVEKTGNVPHVKVSSSALPSGASTEEKQDDAITQLALAVSGLTDLLTELKLKADLTETQAVLLITGFATSLKQLPNGHNVAVSNMIPAVETGLATLAKQLPAGHTVTVINLATLATNAKQLLDSHNVTIKGTATSGAQLIKLDDATYAIASIDIPHLEIHEKKSFHCHYDQEVSDTGDKTIISFKTPNNGDFVHIIASVASQDATRAYILESPTITDNTGAPLTVFNRYREGVLVPSGVIDTSQNPDVSDQATLFTEVTMGNVTGGVELDSLQLVAGQGPRIIGGRERGEEEWVLDEDTLYAFIIESLNNNANLHNLRLDWYENTRNE